MRCFIALPLPEAALDDIDVIRDLLSSQIGGCRWTRRDNLHLTLSFLGEIDEPGLAASRAALAAFEADLPGLPSFRPGRLAWFPGPRRPRVLVLTAAEERLLDEIHRRVAVALALEAAKAQISPLDSEWPDADNPGSLPHRPWKAHISLARSVGSRPRRLDQPAVKIAEEGLSAGSAWFPDRVALYESRLEQGRTRYAILEERPLLPRAPS